MNMRFAVRLIVLISLASILGYFSYLNPPKLQLSHVANTDLYIRTQWPDPNTPIAGVDIDFPDEFVSIDLLTRPNEIVVGEAFILQATFSGGIRKLVYQHGIQTDVLWTPLAFIDDALKTTSASLKVASAVVKPDQVQQIGDDLLVKWSVFFENPKEHLGLLELASTDFPNGGLSGEISFELTERKGFWVWAALVGIPLSALAALVTVIQAILQWRDRKAS
ncbi:MAG: hypothetical protein AAGD43_32350 [Pseudomonadota bacterium]